MGLGIRKIPIRGLFANAAKLFYFTPLTSPPQEAARLNILDPGVLGKFPIAASPANRSPTVGAAARTKWQTSSVRRRAEIRLANLARIGETYEIAAWAGRAKVQRGAELV